MHKRPGHASVQYNDAKGEATADISDQLSDLQCVARELGFPKGGRVVGISISGISNKDPEIVSATIQATPEYEDTKTVNQSLLETGGELVVNEFYLANLNIRDILKCFKRFQISLFTKHIKAKTITVAERITIES